ncbi:MAG: hypothetical protein M3Y49_04200 [Actinomycetota bacterium]|nr:hypothetical protein [Actinomycetota bacterium]
MCFSIQADLVSGAALLPVGVLTLREVRHKRELPFAALPLLFAFHQLIEALVWAGEQGQVSPCVQQAAAFSYVLFALPVLPTLVPIAVLMLEPRGSRLRVAPFAAIGIVVSADLLHSLLQGPLTIDVHRHALVYNLPLSHGIIVAVFYVVAVVGPSVLSGYRSIIVFGVANLVGLIAVALLYTRSFASLWCVYAALTSVLIFIHMRLRRRFTDAHRLRGEPLITAHPPG